MAVRNIHFNRLPYFRNREFILLEIGICHWKRDKGALFKVYEVRVG